MRRESKEERGVALPVRGPISFSLGGERPGSAGLVAARSSSVSLKFDAEEPGEAVVNSLARRGEFGQERTRAAKNNALDAKKPVRTPCSNRPCGWEMRPEGLE